jgi:hypothetical protein
MKTIMNLTELAVIEEIESVLETYPDHPYQQAFAIPDLRQELIAYILSRVSNHYIAIDSEQAFLSNLRTLTCSLEQKVCIEKLVHQGIEKILSANTERMRHQIPEPIAAGFAPSNWFG